MRMELGVFVRMFMESANTTLKSVEYLLGFPCAYAHI